MITDPIERSPLDIVHKWNHVKNTATKCDFCADTPYWDGDEPACVAVCSMRAIAVTSKIPTRLGEKGHKVNLRPEE